MDKLMKEMLKRDKKEESQQKKDSWTSAKSCSKSFAWSAPIRSFVMSIGRPLCQDEELNGHMCRREFQKTVDKYLNLTEEESALLDENCGFVDGTHKADIDYTSY